ncbi:uncharacterized protein LOC131166054 [Malania oleifera]|uniref:uncharacterized protein LOC131166054 n=1 Tax=Malania oleifera TaxID=397392 RepID=UPI0025ADE30D|nr:uncharacterized protein LOC131166054 [Malania oleifera]XP_057980265.1 uncharacterized protein LOC131166054 [Malania oleifera]
MAKKSQRRPMRYEKDHSGCMSGLISIFDFRNGRSTQKLLSDKKRGNKNAIGARHSSSKVDLLTDFDEKYQGTDDLEGMTAVTAGAGEPPSVKKLIEEEMYIEQDPRQQISNAVVEAKRSNSECGSHVKKNHKRTKKKTCNVHTHGLNAAENSESANPVHQNQEKQFTSYLNINAIVEEFCSQMHQTNLNGLKLDQHDELDTQSKQQFSVSEEKLSEATKVFLSQNFINGPHLTDGEAHPSKEFLDALQTLNSNKELFLELLQDPNSLLVKHIQSLLDSQELEKDKKSKFLTGSNLSEQDLSNAKPSEELVERKQHNFFRRKNKSHGRNLLGNDSAQVSNRIVILKPGPAALKNSETETELASPLQSHYSVGKKEPSERAASHFSFTEIKRRFKNAVGKDRRGVLADDGLSKFSHDRQNLGASRNGIGSELSGMNSPNRNHYFIERIPKPFGGIKKGGKGVPKDPVEHETSSNPERRVSNIYIEAKKHLSEMVNDGNEKEGFASRQDPDMLGRILSLPDYNFSPVSSPRRDREHKTAKTRFSAYEKFRRVNENSPQFKQEKDDCLGPSTQNLKILSSIPDDNPADKVESPISSPNISDEHIHDTKSERTLSSGRNEMSFEVNRDIVKMTNLAFQEENNVLHVSAEPSSSCMTRNQQNDDTADICDEKGSSESLKLDSDEDIQPPSSPFASPSRSLIIEKDEHLESSMDKPERPSPISVLEPLFTEDDISPASTRNHHVELPVKPQQIEFEEHDSSACEQGIHVKTCMEEKDSLFEYVKAVLQASRLNWDEFFMRLTAPDILLDPSLIHEVELFPNHLCCDQKLLFDCINEVLVEVFQWHFGFAPWVSFVKPNIRPIPNAKTVIFEVWDGVKWHIHPPLSPPTLDQIVGKDMAKSGIWMDIRSDAETIGVEMGEAIFNELIEDTILGCVKERPESESPAFSAELIENENSTNL